VVAEPVDAHEAARRARRQQQAAAGVGTPRRRRDGDAGVPAERGRVLGVRGLRRGQLAPSLRRAWHSREEAAGPS
jgi:hypothetical protein